LTPRKELRLKVPEIPRMYLRDFTRGYFDGDGCISFGNYKRLNRKSKVFLLTTRFASGSKNFLFSLWKKLKGGFIFKTGGCNYLCFSKKDSGILFNYMYNKVPPDCYLERKYNKFKESLGL